MHRARTLIGVLFLLLSAFSCRRNSEFSTIRAGDLGIVNKGTYRGRLKFLGAGGAYKSLVDSLRGDVEKDEMVLLDVISDEYYTLPHYAYEYKYAASDETMDQLVLRYFARIAEHPIYAGYQIQLVFSLSSGRLLKVFTCEVPLE